MIGMREVQRMTGIREFVVAREMLGHESYLNPKIRDEAEVEIPLGNFAGLGELQIGIAVEIGLGETGIVQDLRVLGKSLPHFRLAWFGEGFDEQQQGVRFGRRDRHWLSAAAGGTASA